MTNIMRDELAAPSIVDRSTFQDQLYALRLREKAHTHEGDAIAATRRRLPMVEVDPAITLIGLQGPVLDGGSAGCTSFAICDGDPKSLRLIGPLHAASK